MIGAGSGFIPIPLAGGQRGSWVVGQPINPPQQMPAQLKTQRVERSHTDAPTDAVYFGFWGRRNREGQDGQAFPPSKEEYEKLVSETRKNKRSRVIAYTLMMLSLGSTTAGLIDDISQSARPVHPIHHRIDLLTPERLAKNEAIREHLRQNLRGVPGQVFNHYVQLAEYTLPRTVLVRAGNALGTGFVAREDGFIVTNQHVVGNKETVTITLHNGRIAEGKVLARSEALDLAVVKVDPREYGLQKLPALQLADSVKPGEAVMAVGNPHGYGWSITTGMVSSLARKQAGGPVMLQTDTAINPGNSGGPLVNMGGEVVGVNTVVMPKASNIAFSIGLPALKEAIPLLIEIAEERLTGREERLPTLPVMPGPTLEER